MHLNFLWKTPAWRAQKVLKSGIQALTSSELSEAILYFEQALSLEKGNPDAHYYFARSLFAIGATELSDHSIQLAVNRFPNIFSVDGYHGVYYPFNVKGSNRSMAARFHIEDEQILGSICQVEEAAELLSQEKFSLGAQKLIEALQKNPWNVNAYYYLASAYTLGGQSRKSVITFDKAIETFPYLFRKANCCEIFQGMQLDEHTTKNFYHSLSNQYAILRSMLETCPRTGKSGKTLGADAEKWLLNKYTSVLDEWRKPGERLAGYKNSNTYMSGSELPFLMVLPQYIKCNPDWVEDDLSLHCEGTARKYFSRFYRFNADGFHSNSDQLVHERSEENVHQEINKMAEIIDTVRPKLVFFDGNFIGGGNSIGLKSWNKLKKLYSFKLIVIIRDIYDAQPNFAKYWSTVADLIVALNDHAYLSEVKGACKVLVWPGVPVDQKLFQSVNVNNKEFDVSFVGSRKSFRDLWGAYLKDSNVDFMCKFTDQSRVNSLDKKEYIRILKCSKLILNNGLVSPTEHHNNFRIFETMAAGSVLLQQDFKALHRHLEPYVHYAPFSNINEMITTAQFLLKYENIRVAIENESRKWIQNNFQGNYFWSKILSAIS